MKRAIARAAAVLAAAGLVIAVSTGVANARPADWWLHAPQHATTTAVSTNGQ